MSDRLGKQISLSEARRLALKTYKVANDRLIEDRKEMKTSIVPSKITQSQVKMYKNKKKFFLEVRHPVEIYLCDYRIEHPYEFFGPPGWCGVSKKLIKNYHQMILIICSLILIKTNG